MSNNEDNNDIYEEPAYEVTKKKKRKWPVILGVCLAGAAAAIAIPLAVMNSKTVKLSDYIVMTYDGISGYATPKSVINTEALYNALAGEEKDAARLEAYKNFADSVSASVAGEKVANGDAIEVNVTFDEELRKNTGYSVSGETFTVTAEGIDPGKSVNLFENASINITGISPDATIAVENKSSDEYLKTLEFSADKASVANGDSVALRCNVTDEELAEHGYTTTSLSAMYEVSGLSEYIGVEDITKSVADKLVEDNKALIEAETADNTYRMIYKLTNNAEYLTVPNTETAEGIELSELYLFKRKPETERTGNAENMIVAIYKADLKVQDKTETGYFAFIYPDSYVTADGKTELNTDALIDTMQMNTDLNALNEAVIKSREGSYEIMSIDPGTLTDEKNEVSETTAAESTGVGTQTDTKTESAEESSTGGN